MSAEVRSEIWKRLVEGRPLDGLNLDHVNGRMDLRNLHVAEPYVAKKATTAIADVEFLQGITTIRGANWRSIDFSLSQLPGLRLFGCSISDCIFDECRLQDFRVWGTTFSNVSFRSANLRGAALGGVDGAHWNVFENVNFTSADLRGTMYVAAEFVGCDFRCAKLEKVDFQTSTFTDCSFEGELREVLFYRRGFKGENFPPNEMRRVDFSRAKLRWTEFRGLDLDDVRFPEDDDHLVVRNFPEFLEKLWNKFKDRPDVGSKGLAALLATKRKWLGPNQKVGVFNKNDILEIAGNEGLEEFLKTIESGSHFLEHGAQPETRGH